MGLALVAVASGAAAIVQANMLERLLLHLICFIGSQLEPYDMILPKKSSLKVFIRVVQKAKRDYDVKHGLVSIDDQTFFDEDDAGAEEEEEEGVEPARSEEGAEEDSATPASASAEADNKEAEADD